MQRQRREVPPQRCQPLLLVQRADRLEKRHRVLDSLRDWRLGRARQEVLHGLIRGDEAHLQAELLQRRAPQLGRLEVLQRRGAPARVQVVAHAGPHAPRAALALFFGRLADPARLQRRDARVGVVALLLDAAAVHNPAHVIDGHRRFGDVSAQNDLLLARRRPLKRLALLLRRHHRVQQDDGRLGSKRAAGILQRVAHARDILPAVQKYQYGAGLARPQHSLVARLFAQRADQVHDQLRVHLVGVGGELVLRERDGLLRRAIILRNHGRRVLLQRRCQPRVAKVRRPVGRRETIARRQTGVGACRQQGGRLGGAALAAQHHQRRRARLRVLVRHRACGRVLAREELQLR
mmetsp:Transcript_15021/g.46733  ORF Transcript_15021/g.46733 Transcript_15021/m.46733 type:complete len:349 (+) Transcript_15021:461-1507(+)